jgi:hypothetical protein
MRTALLILVLVAGVAGGLAWTFLREPERYEAPPAPPATSARAVSALGVASCSGRSCHGSLEPTANPQSWQTEYTHWLSDDPHARAYHLLFEPRSRDIAERLGLEAAHTSSECLACHVTPRLARDHGDSEWLQRERRFGVSCEACHGKADGWIDAHLTETWRQKSPQEKQQLGMTALADPIVLTKTCAGCHVGVPPDGDVPGRDVNHDLIAAGHPRLLFEMTSYFANLPRHWREAAVSGGPDRPHQGTFPEARLWAVGQAVTAEAALTLLQHRAVSEDAPWPEFAEYDCASCHHQLATPAQRQARSGDRLGAPPWGTWSFAMIPVLAELAGGEADLSDLDKLRRRLSEFPPRDEWTQQAHAEFKQVARLRGRFAEMPLDQPTTARWLKRLGEHALSSERLNWDRAEQTFLALYALNRTVKDDVMRRRLARLAEVRAFPRGYETPRGFDPAHFAKLLRD